MKSNANGPSLAARGRGQILRQCASVRAPQQFLRASGSQAASWLACVALGGLLGSLALEAQTVYSTDFEGVVGPEWSLKQVSATPTGGRKFLGEFGNQTVRLTLTNLPPHTAGTIEFDLFTLRSWDGNATAAGPDLWSFAVVGGPTLLRTTFGSSHPSSVAAGQAFPGGYPAATFNAHVGAVETNSLGYTFSPYGAMDAVYHLSFNFADAAETLALAFSAGSLQVLTDESWGLDNVRVAVLNAPNGVLDFERPWTTVLEAATNAVVTVRRLGAVAGAVTVDLAVNSSGGRVAATTNQLAFADGQASAAVTLAVADNQTVEPDETVTLTLSSPTGGAQLAANATARLVVLDDDGHFELTQPQFTVAEGTAGFSAGVRWTGATNRVVPVRVDFATRDGTAKAASDYDAASGTFLFTGTTTNRSVFLAIRDNTVPEPDEVYYVGLRNPYLGSSLAAVREAPIIILDDDTPAAGRAVNWRVESLVVQPDGKVLIGGGFDQVQAFNRSSIARLEADGGLDASFLPGTGASS